MAILGGVYFLHIWPKNPLKGSKWTFLVTRVIKFSYYSHLEGFLIKSEESRPILGGSNFFTFGQKCLFTELEPSPVWNFDAILLFKGKFFQIFAFYKRWSYCIFPSIEHRHSHIWVLLGISTCPNGHSWLIWRWCQMGGNIHRNCLWKFHQDLTWGTMSRLHLSSKSLPRV